MLSHAADSNPFGVTFVWGWKTIELQHTSRLNTDGHLLSTVICLLPDILSSEQSLLHTKDCPQDLPFRCTPDPHTRLFPDMNVVPLLKGDL